MAKMPRCGAGREAIKRVSKRLHLFNVFSPIMSKVSLWRYSQLRRLIDKSKIMDSKAARLKIFYRLRDWFTQMVEVEFDKISFPVNRLLPSLNIFVLFRYLKKLKNTPHLVGGADLSNEEKWRVLDALYDFKPIITATAAVSVACWFASFHHFDVEAGLWMLSSIVILLARFILFRAYVSRSLNRSAQVWMNLFFIAAVVTGFQWGLGGFILANSQDGTVSGAIFGVEAALMAGAAARGYSFPSATIVQVNITASMLAFFSLLAGQYVIFFMMIVYVVHQTAFIISLTKIKLKEINSERQRHVLLATLERTNEELASANTMLQNIAKTDALTGIANRRSFEHELPLRWAQALGKRTSLSLLLIDIDHFKRFNDAYGHQVGDKCLALVANAIKSVVRYPSDHAARFGGEEFALILPDSDFCAAKLVAERLLTAVRSIAVPVAADRFVRVSVSVGIGLLIPDETMNDSQLISTADQALYRAKESGRNCVR